MKTFRSTRGPFNERPFFTLKEIEDVCLEALTLAQLLPSEPGPVRIERFIEKKFGVTPNYEVLPEGVLGFTRFGPKGVEAVMVSKALAEDITKTSDRRVTTTLAHEAGHGLLHSYLFVLGDQTAPLFDGEVQPDSPKIMCRQGSVLKDVGQGAYDGRWWEYQANQAMGALLLPRALVAQCLRPILVATGSLGNPVLKTAHRAKAIQLLSESFQVNPIVARIRLDQLHPEKDERQLTL
jgi:hypothetical protein